MRYPRFKPEPEATEAYYHLITRTVNGEWLFGDVEKEVLRKHLWLVADRCGIDVLTYQILSNHFHVVACAPQKTALSDQELLRRYALLHSGESAWEQRKVADVERILKANGQEAEAWRRSEMSKMNDVSEYMKLLKQRFSIWFNRTHNRFGTLWAERFKSVLLESGEAVRQCAAYVDLNAVRAHLCGDPKDYRFSGYAEAVAGSRRAQEGIRRAMSAPNWSEAQSRYRLLLFRAGAKSRRDTPAAVTPAQEEKVTAEAGELGGRDILRCRCRYFTDGAVLGSRAFVLEQLALFRRLTGCGRKTEPRPCPEVDETFAVLRRFRVAAAPI